MVYISLSTHLFEVCLGLSVLDNIRELMKNNPGTLLTEKPPVVDSPSCLQPGNLLCTDALVTRCF